MCFHTGNPFMHCPMCLQYAWLQQYYMQMQYYQQQMMMYAAQNPYVMQQYVQQVQRQAAAQPNLDARQQMLEYGKQEGVKMLQHYGPHIVNQLLGMFGGGQHHHHPF